MHLRSFSLLAIVFLLGLASCKFQEQGDQTRALPALPGADHGLLPDLALKMDTLHNAVTLLVPSDFYKDNGMVSAALGADHLPVTYYNSDSCVTLEITYTNQLSKGDVSTENLTMASEELQFYLVQAYDAALITNEYITVNDREYLRLEADLNWNGYRCATSIFATVVGPKLFVANLRYPPENREDSEALRNRILESIDFL